MNQCVVITGTDTGIGKTVFSAALVRALGACYWKPVQSGMEGETDSETVKRLAGISQERIFPELWKLNTPVSPHLAARLDQVIIDPQGFTLPQTDLPLVIEGAGGLLVPLTEQCVFAEIFARWQLPVILCARTELGTINHTLLSLEAMRHRDIPIFGVALIGNEQIDTANIIAKLGKTRILGRLPRLNLLTPEILHKTFLTHFPLTLFQASV